MPFLLTSADYTVRQGSPVVLLQARDSQGKREQFELGGFTPYFYAPAAEVAEKIEIMESIDHVQVARVNCVLPSEVAKRRENYTRHYEADILFPWRFLIDRDIRSGFDVRDGVLVPADDIHIRLTRMYLDIEVEVTGNPIDPIGCPDMILTICYSMNGEEPITLSAENEVDEIDMLKQFIRIVQDEDPDIITGWNIFYDLATIIGRCRKSRINPNGLSPFGYVDIRYPHIKIHGRNALDLLAAFKQYYQNKVFPSYKLDDIAARKEYKLGWTNDEPFDYANHMNREHMDLIVPYNRDDVQKLIDIDRHLELIDHFDGLRKTAGCSLDDSLTISRYAGVMFLREYHGKYAVPSSRRYTKRQKFEGAHVVQPQRGIFNMVAALDFARMYPSIIISHNMSPETLVRDPSIYSSSELYEIDGIYFLREPVGVAVAMLERLNDARNEVKAKMKSLSTDDPRHKVFDEQQYSFKQMTAAVYGYFSFPGSRVYCPEISKSTTFIGRKLVYECLEYIESVGLNPLYGDTDSVLTSIPTDDLEVAVQQASELEVKINNLYGEIARKEGWKLPATMECEQIYNPLLFSGVKKRYAGRCVWYKGKPDDEVIIKGFEAKRSDSSSETQFIQTKVLEIILNGGTESEVRKVILESLSEFKKKGLTEVGIPKPMRKDIFEYAGNALSERMDIVFANQHMGKDFKAGSRPYRFYVKHPPEGLPTSIFINGKYKKVDRIALDENDDLREYDSIIDWNLQGVKIIENKVQPILKAFGLSISEVLSGQKQLALGDFK